MRPRIDEIEIPQDGLRITQTLCQEVLREHTRDSKLITVLRLLRLEITSYLRTALIGILILLVAAYFLPQTRIAMVTLYFFLLGILAIYDIYKQHIHGVEELLHTVYVNGGRSFLYKCLLCSAIQFVCFLLSVLILTGIFEESLTLVILNSILPIYLIPCITILFEPLIKAHSNVLLVYIISYVIYLIFSNSPIIQLTYVTFTNVVTASILTSCLLFILLFIKYRRHEKEETSLWN